MNLFDILVEQALELRPELAPLRLVVEKELLHHDILQIMQDHNLLSSLTFIGGTCLRMGYGSIRLSEDLDFTGGTSFDRETLAKLGTLIAASLKEKYGLVVYVTAPEKDILNVDTWKIKVITRPEKKHLPAQRINIDICSVPSYEQTPLLLNDAYNLGRGASNLIVVGQSREEIFTDKLLAFAFRPNRIKYRDLWDIVWLNSRGISPRLSLIEPKLHDRNRTRQEFYELFAGHVAQLTNNAETAQEFKQEMQRFLPESHLPNGNASEYWQVLIRLLEDITTRL